MISKVFSLRNWVAKQLMKTDKSGIMKVPPKGQIDFGEMLLKESLFKKGVDPKTITSEKQLNNILDTPVVPKSERAKPKKSGDIIEVDFDKGRWNKAGGGRAGLSYLLAEDTNERMPLAGGGSGKPPINFYFDVSGGAGRKEENFLGIQGLNKKGYSYGGTFGADTTFPFLGGDLSIGGELGFGRDKSNINYKGKPIDFLSNVGETKLGDQWDVGLKWSKKFNEGGRAGFKDGKGPKMSRRSFLKTAAGLASIPFFGKFFKWAKPAAKVADVASVPIKSGVDGMPAWFKPLVNKVIKEGDDVTKKFATVEREIVHKTKLPDSQTDVLVTQNLDSGNVKVDIGLEKHGFADGKFGQPVRLEYKVGESYGPYKTVDVTTGEVHTVIKKGKHKDEFWVEEAEFTGGHPENVKFEESTINKFGKHESDFREVEKFAIGKNTIKGQIGGKSSLQKQNEDLADHFSNYPEPDDFASGGVAKLLGE